MLYRFNVHAYTRDSLSSLPSILGGKTNTIGLYDGTLYDTLGPNEGVGNVTVKATGFNISCGYIADINPRYHAKDYCWKFVIHGATYCIPDTHKTVYLTKSGADTENLQYQESSLRGLAGALVRTSLSSSTARGSRLWIPTTIAV